MSDIYDFRATSIDGGEQSLGAWRGQVLLVVNVASRCVFTPQYEALQALHRAHADEGFAVLGFPCDQFGHQEPGDEAQIREFCSTSYGVDFPLFSKIEVNGEHAHPLYRWLTAQAPGVLGSRRIKWNFTKFLVGRDGRVLKRFAPNEKPGRIEKHVVAALAN